MSITPYLWFVVSFMLLVLVQKWIHRHLHGVAYLLTGDPEMAVMLYALPLLPGVALHELSHALMATLLGVKSAKLTIIPRRQPDGHIRLGSVQVERVDALRASLIGLAPLLFGGLAVLLISTYAFGVSTLGEAVRAENIGGVIASLSGVLNAPDAWLWLYLLFAIANALVPSPADRVTWPPVILFSVLMLILALIFGLNSAVADVGNLIGEGLRWLAAAFTITLVVNVPFLIVIWFGELMVGRVKGQRVAYTTSVDDRQAAPRKRKR
jgi:hypothetical protein